MGYTGTGWCGLGVDRWYGVSCHGQLINPEGQTSLICCPDTTWNEETYHAVKGDETWMFWVEDILRRNVFTHFSSEGLRNGMWDLGGPTSHVPSNLTLPSALENRCVAALRNFDDTFQMARWERVANLIATQCTSRGYFAGWRQRNELADKPRLDAAAKRVFGHVPTQAEWDGFVAAALDVMKRSPRYASSAPTTAAPPPEWGDGAWYHQPPQPILAFFSWNEAAQVIARPWTTEFLNIFAPAARMTVSSMAKLATMATKAPTAAAQWAARKAALKQTAYSLSDESTASTSSYGKTIAVAAGAAALIAIGYMLLG